MKTGLFFGSFNPIHIGHLIIASAVLNETDLSKIIFIVSPQNPLKEEVSLLNAAIRLRLVLAGIESDDRFQVSDIEFKMPLPSYTIETLQAIEKENPNNQFSIIVGSDSYLNLPHWKEYDQLIQKNIIVYPRPGYATAEIPKQSNIIVLKSGLLDISSTAVRNLISNGKSIRYLVPDKVLSEIEDNNYYK